MSPGKSIRCLGLVFKIEAVFLKITLKPQPSGSWLVHQVGTGTEFTFTEWERVETWISEKRLWYLWQPATNKHPEFISPSQSQYSLFTSQVKLTTKCSLALQIFIIVYQFAKHRVTLCQFFRRFNWKEVVPCSIEFKMTSQDDRPTSFVLVSN